MAHELREGELVRGLTSLVADVNDLIHKEFQLARAEIISKLNAQVRAGLWLAIAGLLGFTMFLLVVEGAVLALTAAGLALHWSCFLVAGLLAVAAILAAYIGRKGLGDVAPLRSMGQLNQDIRTIKERLQ
jgi:uncharacterized membrane protein YgcG